MNGRIIPPLIFLFLAVQSFAQRALPGFTVKEVGKGKTSISWINPYPSCNQLAVQRSTDGKNFRTIFSAQSPELPTNGYVDNKMPVASKVYYRIFYVLTGGNYFFTDSKSPGQESQEQTAITFEDDARARIEMGNYEARKEVPDTDNKTVQIFKRGQPALQLTPDAYRYFRDSLIRFTQDSLSIIKTGEINWRPFIPKPKDYVSVFVKDTLLIQIELPFYKRFKDSVTNTTKDTIYQITTFRAELHRFRPKPVWKPSVYVFTNSSGLLNIAVPEKEAAAYRIIFFDAEGKELFRINKIKEPELILDKANFKKSGWYDFELYKNNDLIEKNKFFLQKD